MISRIGFAPARAALPLKQAQVHWAGAHAAVARLLPGVQRYWQNHAVLKDGQPLLPWTGFDCCSEFDFADIADMDRAFLSDAYAMAVRPDEKHLIDRRGGGMLIADRHNIAGTIGAAEFRWIRFHRLAPLRSLADLDQSLRTTPPVEGARARELYVAIDGPRAAQRFAMYDAVEIDWFDTAEAAYAASLSESARIARRASGGLVRGSDHLIARVLRII